MGADMIVTMIACPVVEAGTESYEDRSVAAYTAVIGRASASEVAWALIPAHEYDVSEFGGAYGEDFDLEFHDGVEGAVAAFEQNPIAIAAGRSYLVEKATEFLVFPSQMRADVLLGNQWVAVFAGLSWGDEPFDGHGAVAALAQIPELSMDRIIVSDPTRDRSGLIERARDALQEYHGDPDADDIVLINAIDPLAALAGLTCRVDEGGTVTLEEAHT